MNTQYYLGSLQTRRLRAVHVLQKYSLLSRFSVICIKVMMMHSMSRMEKVLNHCPLCQICGERAARHVHYGATTCFSCRAFFRRSLQNNTAAKSVPVPAPRSAK